LGQLQSLSQGSEVLIVAMGSVAMEAAAATQALREKNVSCGLAILAHLNPAPADHLASLLAKVPLVLTVEAHYCAGGAGSLVAEVIAERGLPCRLLRCGVRQLPEAVSGSARFHHQMHGLRAEQLVETALQFLGRTS
jgi:transketolase